VSIDNISDNISKVYRKHDDDDWKRKKRLPFVETRQGHTPMNLPYLQEVNHILARGVEDLFVIKDMPK
jgi:hypothetical protein